MARRSPDSSSVQGHSTTNDGFRDEKHAIWRTQRMTASRRTCKTLDGREGTCLPVHAPTWGVLGYVSAVQPILKPVQDFVLNPANPVRAQDYPSREFPCLFKAGNVLWRIQDQHSQLTLRKYPHHDLSMNEEHRDARVTLVSREAPNLAFWPFRSNRLMRSANFPGPFDMPSRQEAPNFL